MVFFCQAFLILALFSVSCTHTHTHTGPYVVVGMGQFAIGKSVRVWGFLFFIFIVSHSKSRAQELKLSFATPHTYTHLIIERKWPMPQVPREKWPIKLVELQVLNLTWTFFGEKVADRQKLKCRN